MLGRMCAEIGSKVAVSDDPIPSVEYVLSQVLWGVDADAAVGNRKFFNMAA